MVPRWRIVGNAFPASHVQHISDMHSKFALRPHHVWKYGRHPAAESWMLVLVLRGSLFTEFLTMMIY